MRVLVTGGKGFLGAWIMRRLARRGCALRVFDIAEDRRLIARIAGADVASRLDWWTGDIVSSGQTMIETVRVIRNLAKTPPVCVAVHALFSAATEAELVRLGSKVVSTNTVGHPTNAIDVSEAISGCVQDLVGR